MEHCRSGLRVTPMADDGIRDDAIRDDGIRDDGVPDDHCVPALSQIVLTCALLALTRHSHTKRKNSHSTTISARW